MPCARAIDSASSSFVARHGCLTGRANALAFRRDPDYPLLLSLEHYDEEAEAATKEMIGRQVGSITVSQVIVSEMIPHKEEYYCAVKSTREGTDILVANCGGIEVESNWERVNRLAVEIGEQPSEAALEKLATHEDPPNCGGEARQG